MEDLQELRYPTGHFNCPKEITKEQISEWVETLETLPKRLHSLVKNLSDEQLETRYRPDGWTLRQVIHHVADSHHHSYTRFKWALTEKQPLIKAYEEKEWSNLFDARTAPIQLSLDYIKVLHAKLVYLLKGLSPEEMKIFYIHPDGNTKVTVAENIGKYAWHSNHHYAHIANLVKRKGWS
ncbi:MAG: putative metal-dependent hydrolase [Maribacter sp.]